VPYALARTRGEQQLALLKSLTSGKHRLEQIDLDAAAALAMQQLSPLPA
jgi:hypothetical protein